MKFASLFFGLAYAHMEMLTPMPRRSKLFRSAYSGDQIDYNMSAPLDEVEYTYPCRGYAPGPVSAEYTAGQDVPITLHGTANHNGGHCQISISYDNVNYIVIKTIYGDCMVNTLSYSAHLPENAPAGKATLAWTWINRSGNREFYMNCADVKIKGKDNVCLTGKKILIANLENTPTFPEGFSNDYGKALFDAQPVATACGQGSAPSYPTAPSYPSAPSYSTPEVPTQVTPSSNPSQTVSTTLMASSSQVVVTSSQVAITSSQVNTPTVTSSHVNTPVITSSQVNTPVATSSQVNTPVVSSSHLNTPVITSSQVNVPVTTSSQVNAPETTSSQVQTSSQVITSSQVVPSSSASSQPTSKKPGHCRPRPTSNIPIVPTSSVNYPSSTPLSSSVAVPTSPSSSHKPSKCSHKSTATVSASSSQMPAPSSSFVYPSSSQMPAPSSSFGYSSYSQIPAPSSSFGYSSSSQLASKSSHVASSTLVYPTSMQPSYPTSNPGASDCVDGTMKCMGSHAIAKCFLKTQYVHACPLGTTCQFMAGYDRCV